MRLINYGPGEVTDRLTILALKILIGAEKGRPVDHFETERTALLQQIRSRTLNGVWFEQVLELAAVNGQLWQAEDLLRAIREKQEVQQAQTSVTWQHVGELAFRIQALNDRRAELVTLINTNAGEKSAAEKL